MGGISSNGTKNSVGKKDSQGWISYHWFFFDGGTTIIFSKNRVFIKTASKRYSRDLFCLVQKSYIMTLNIISPFPYHKYAAQIVPFGTTSGYLFNRVNTSSLSPALWLTWGSDESQMGGWFLWCGVSMYVWVCARVYVPINCSNNPGKQKKCWMEVLWVGLAMEQSLSCALLVSEFPKIAATQWSYSLQKAAPSKERVFVRRCVGAQAKYKIVCNVSIDHHFPFLETILKKNGAF